MRLVGYTVSYEVAAGWRTRSVEGAGRFEVQDAMLCLDADEESFRLIVEPRRALRVTRCSLEFEHEFSRDDEIMMNGHQSWTDSRVLKAGDRLRGLAGIPRRIIEEHALDALGDYHFVEYTNEPGMFHGFTYAHTTSAQRATTLIASLDDSAHFTRIDVNARDGSVVLRPETSPDELGAGQQVELLAALCLTGSVDEVYDRWAQLYRFAPRPNRPIVGYSSWYRHFDSIDEEKIAADLASASYVFSKMRTGDAVRVFQIDDGWCTVGDWDHVDANKFPNGLAPLAHAIAGEGFVPGLWLAPFVCASNSLVFEEHPEWLLKDEHGKLVKTGSHWGGGFALDFENGEVREHLARVLKTVTEDWGFKFLKLDFLYAACLVPQQKTRGTAMREAMEFLRACVGDDVLIDGCGVPLASAFGIVDCCRIGCDVGPDWNDKLHMRLLHRERVSTKHSLGDTLARAPLDGRMFGNDPDVVFLREDVRLNLMQKRRLLEAASECGSMLLTSDDMGQWGTYEFGRFQQAVNALLDRKGARA